ncbi:NDT80 / phoG like DNA-binding family protein [Sarocladium implicatum]|nr:NDT80 / phoG like DNA-binding family protein [Sarocladium implicatum]
MAAFNSMSGMPSGPADAMAMNGQLHGALPMDSFDHDLGFDDPLLDGSNLPPLPFTPGYDFESFAPTFEDPFSSFQSRQFNAVPSNNNPDPLRDESSPQEPDDKLLGFSDSVVSATVVDESGNLADLSMTAELRGMFFVAEDVFGGETSDRPLELTCYRRNLWQCFGQINLPRVVTGIINEQGQQIPLVELSASITARESIEGKATEIISIPWKSANPQVTEESKVAAAPPNVTVDLGSGQELDANRVSVPISWKRLQFKHATANNGRRKGLQQHYTVQITLLGKAKTGESIKIAEIQSGPVIVRGRSPRNFDSRKDVPLTGEKKLERRNTAGSDNVVLKTEKDSVQTSQQGFQAPQPTEWATPQPYAQPSQSPHPAKKIAMTTPTMGKPPVPSWSKDNSSPNKNIGLHQPQYAPAHHRGSMSRPSMPISLSLSDDDRSPNRSSADIASPQLGKAGLALGQNAGSSPAEEADPLYEYFPLSLDDWMPPVDAVYRPHVVHHTIVPPELKAQQVQSKSKRYFLPE